MPMKGGRSHMNTVSDAKGAKGVKGLLMSVVPAESTTNTGALKHMSACDWVHAHHQKPSGELLGLVGRGLDTMGFF